MSLGHPAGQTGVYRPVSQGFPVICFRKMDRKGHLCWDTGWGVPGTPGHPGCFQKFYVIFSNVPFLLPIHRRLKFIQCRTGVGRPHSTKLEANGCSRKCPLHLVRFNGVVCSNTLFSNTSVSANSLSFRADSTFKGSRTPHLVERFWVPALGASFGNGQVSLIFGVSNFCAFFASTCTLTRQRTRGEKAQKLGTPKIRDTWPFPTLARTNFWSALCGLPMESGNPLEK